MVIPLNWGPLAGEGDCPKDLHSPPPNRLKRMHLNHSIHFVTYTLGCGASWTHQTSWLESTGVCGVRQIQAGGSSLQKRA